MEWWHVYLFTRLDNLSALFCITSFVGIATSIILAIAWYVNNDMSGYGKEYETTAKVFKKMLKVSVPTAAILLLIAIAIPTQKEMAAIYILPKLASSDLAKEAQQLPSDAAKLMRLKLESWINDMEPKKAEIGK